MRHDLEQTHVVAVEAGLAVAGQHDGADGRVLAHERRGQQRHAGRVHEQRLAAAHDLERLRAQLGERAALARARGGDRRLAELLAGQCPDGRAVVRQRLAQHAQQRTRDVRGPLRGRERARERLQMAHLLERAPRARRHRRRAASDQALVGERDAVLAQPLGLVERGVGRLQQVAQIGSVARPARDPERERQPPAAQVDGREAALEAAADGARVGLRRLGEQQRELLAADPEHAVGRAHAAAQQHAHLAQGVVARDMAARVVELLEVVDVGEHEREARRPRRHQAAHRLVEAAVVGEPRERVRGGLELLALEGAQALERDRGMGDEERGVVDHLGRQRPLAAVPGEVAVRARRGAQRKPQAAVVEVDAPFVRAGLRQRDQRRALERVLARALVAQPGLGQDELALDDLADLHAGEPERAPDGARDDAQHRAVLARLGKARERLPEPAPAGRLARLRVAVRRARPRASPPRGAASGHAPRRRDPPPAEPPTRSRRAAPRTPRARRARAARRSSRGPAARTARARPRAAPRPPPAPRGGGTAART